MRFSHFTNKKKAIKFVTPHAQRLHWKPIGLWLSCGSEWIKYVKREGLPWRYAYKHMYNVDLKKIICLRTKQDIQEFHEKYAVALGNPWDRVLEWLTGKPRTWVIDWNRVRTESGKCGIHIQNARFEDLLLKKEYTWYYTVNVCSVCVWSSDCLRLVEVSKL